MAPDCNPWTQAVASALAVMALAAAASRAEAAGTAFAVDTAEVGDPGNCKVETWVSVAGNSDHLVTANPSCIVGLWTTTEISLQVQRSRADDEWSTSLTPKAKSRMLPTQIGAFGFAAATGFSVDPHAKEVTSVFGYIPATLRLSEIVRINVNGGWLLDREADRNFATYGLGLDWRMTETLTYTIETFGQIAAHVEAPETWPRFQTGLRYRPVDRFSMDFIYGRNINGENSNWFTVGSTIRFPAE